VRHDRRLTRLLQLARLRYSSAHIEDVNVRKKRGLEKSRLLHLAGGDCVRQHETLLLGHRPVLARVGRRATLITSQLPVEHWHSSRGFPTFGDTILDRPVQHVHRITLTGGSLRRLATPDFPDAPAAYPRVHAPTSPLTDIDRTR
jgi:hypothetical protein